LQHAANEARDVNVAKLKARYEKQVATIEDRMLRAQQALEREAEQARSAKFDTALSIGTAVLGALLGRKRVSTTSVNRAGTAMRKAGSARKQAGDVKRAKQTIASLERKLEQLAESFDAEIDALDDAFDAQAEKLSTTLIRPKSTEIEIRYFGIGWVPVDRQ
jgi:site-specific recombinase